MSHDSTSSRPLSWRRRAASIEAAAIAGLAHAVLLTAAIVLVQDRPAWGAPDAAFVDFFGDPTARGKIILALNLAAVSGIAFLWFIGVIRRRIGAREDKLFATVFLGGGLTFVVLMLVGFAIVAAPAVMVELTGATPEADSVRLVSATGRAILSILAPRFAAVFVLSTSMLGRRTGALARWLTVLGQIVGLIMIVNFTISEPMPYFFPAWVALVSVALLTGGRSSRLAPDSAVVD
jgi:hypothetical protein